MITKRRKKENGWNYVIENDSFLNGLERVNLTTTSKGPLGKYAGVFVGMSFCGIPRYQAAEALRYARKIQRAKKKAA